MRSNCLIFALWMVFTRPHTYFAARKSHYYWGPHFLWEKRYRDGRIKMLSLVPQGKNPNGSYTGKPAPKVKRIFPPILFVGVLARGDEGYAEASRRE